LKGLVVTLRFQADASLHLFHNAALTAFVRDLLALPPSEGEAVHALYCVDALESGRIAYQKGETYRFTFIGLPGSDALLERLADALRTLRDDASIASAKVPFRGKVTLHALGDLFGPWRWTVGDPWNGLDLTPWCDENLLEEAGRLTQQAPIHLEFLSPAALRLPGKKLIRGKKKVAICDDASGFTLELLLERLWSTFSDLIKAQPGGGALGRPAGITGEIVERDLFWIGTRYFTDGDDPNRSEAKHTKGAKPNDPTEMAGLMGRIQLPPCDLAILQGLVLCQYLGLGRSRSFGLGRYQLVGESATAPLHRPSPCRSLLRKMMAPETIQAALQRSRHPQAVAHLTQLCLSAQQGTYVPPGLARKDIPKKDGGLRQLAIPPFADRQLQRAVAHILSSNLDTLFSDGSFGYRPKRSRDQARRRLEEARRRGLSWSFETDILQCFDHIPWTALELRLRAIYGPDPFVHLIMAWVKAPFRDGGPPRTMGLPTGSPLSPVLINLFLDDLDRDLEHQNLHATRYADDLVVQCASRSEARQAEGVVQDSLKEKGLQIKPEKTAILPPDVPLHFLGYVLTTQPGTSDDPASEEGDPWWETLEGPTEAVVVPSAEDTWRGAHLIVRPPLRQVALEAGSLVVRDLEGACLQRVPLDGTATVLLLGNHNLTPKALRACLERGVPVHFASAQGRYQGCAASGPAFPGLWQCQSERLADPSTCLDLARRTIHARITHQREVLRRHAHRNPEELQAGMNLLSRCQRDCHRASDLEVLRGLEGLATRTYFRHYADLLPPPWVFPARHYHPAPDPVNALLDLSYSMLRHLTDTSLRARGLDPWTGFYHQPHGRHPILASDLMEPFRHVMERVVLRGLRLLSPADFGPSKEGGVRLSDPALRRYLSHLLIQTQRPFRTPDDATPRTLPGHLLVQAERFRAWVQGQSGTFEPWRNR
jgi:group II intron reverse transcriptase/maturase/CRISPR-associated endonuclease Cas1